MMNNLARRRNVLNSSLVTWRGLLPFTSASLPCFKVGLHLLWITTSGSDTMAPKVEFFSIFQSCDTSIVIKCNYYFRHTTSYWLIGATKQIWVQITLTQRNHDTPCVCVNTTTDRFFIFLYCCNFMRFRLTCFGLKCSLHEIHEMIA
jgi:hypothetical protein